MQFIRGIRLIAALLFAAALAAPASAQLGEVPSLAELAGAIGKEVAAPPKAAATNTGGAPFRSGLAVPSVQPGAAARDVGRQLRVKIEEGIGSPQPAFAQLEAGMLQVLAELEKQLEKAGFAKRDMGVAVAFMFIQNWETANKRVVPEGPSAVAAKSLAGAVTRLWGPRFSKLAPAQQEKVYETILVSAVLMSGFADQFAKVGKAEEEATMRKAAADLFQQLIGVHPSKVEITDDGRITGIAFN